MHVLKNYTTIAPLKLSASGRDMLFEGEQNKDIEHFKTGVADLPPMQKFLVTAIAMLHYNQHKSWNHIMSNSRRIATYSEHLWHSN
jgi:hypothetical protein